MHATDAFGNVTASQGTSSQPFGYTGQQVDGNGLIYLRARYYDPTTGRFLSRDPLGGTSGDPASLNRSTYAENNPTHYVDPSGQIIWIPALIGIGALAGGVTGTLIYYHQNVGTANLTVGGAAGAFGKGAVIGGSAALAGVGATVALAAAGVTGLASAVVANGAAGLVGNAVGNFLNGQPVLQNWLPTTVTGAVVGGALRGLTEEVNPQVGFNAGYSWLQGLGSPLGGYAGRNTARVYENRVLGGIFSSVVRMMLPPATPSQPANNLGAKR